MDSMDFNFISVQPSQMVFPAWLDLVYKNDDDDHFSIRTSDRPRIECGFRPDR
jgi:hypothetical protein